MQTILLGKHLSHRQKTRAVHKTPNRSYERGKGTQLIPNADQEVHENIENGMTERIHNKIVHTKEDVQAYCQNAQK